ncbi:hypothetical protein N431DRAFT_443780 [Stipitochalara longipes BDJ]|nr:hypothetical protein N431DRAFT_443780 [Stipitochalara longipes BDJ]
MEDRIANGPQIAQDPYRSPPQDYNLAIDHNHGRRTHLRISTTEGIRVDNEDEGMARPRTLGIFSRPIGGGRESPVDEEVGGFREQREAEALDPFRAQRDGVRRTTRDSKRPVASVSGLKSLMPVPRSIKAEAERQTSVILYASPSPANLRRQIDRKQQSPSGERDRVGDLDASPIDRSREGRRNIRRSHSNVSGEVWQGQRAATSHSSSPLGQPNWQDQHSGGVSCREGQEASSPVASSDEEPVRDRPPRSKCLTKAENLDQSDREKSEQLPTRFTGLNADNDNNGEKKTFLSIFSCVHPTRDTCFASQIVAYSKSIGAHAQELLPLMGFVSNMKGITHCYSFRLLMAGGN